MKKTRKIAIVLTLSVALCFVIMTSSAQAECLQDWQALVGLENSFAAVSIPTWKITQPGTTYSVLWVDHARNPRFAVYDPLGNSNPSNPDTLRDDLVLDKETRLVWARSANLGGGNFTWQQGIEYCYGLALGNRHGWRISSITEIYTLFVPDGFPPGTEDLFIDMPSEGWWTGTGYESDPNKAYVKKLTPITTFSPEPKSELFGVWPVRGAGMVSATPITLP